MPLPFRHQVAIKLAAFALAGAGFWLVPDDPAYPALLLTAVALPLALLGGLVLWIMKRREKARARAAEAVRGGEAISGGPGNRPAP